MEALNIAEQRRALLTGRASRRPLLRQWQESRQGSALLLLLTPTAARDLPALLDALAAELYAMPSRPVDRLELLVHAPALTAEAASRILALVREFAREISVVLLESAGSGETMLAVGADTLILRPDAALTTLLPPLPPEAAGLRALIAALRVAEPKDLLPLLAANCSAAELGAALASFERTTRLATLVAAARLHPPDPTDLADLVEMLTRWVSRDTDFLTRWQARQLRALQLQTPVHAVEASLAELACLYRPIAAGGALSLIESVEQLRFRADPSDQGWLLGPDEDLQ
ncbi:MAG: hypothetical protein HQ461_13920 [Deltaproteobacteria bacterium]|nr:hypothetical protein [Deltaproteobacteria bacterium]